MNRRLIVLSVFAAGWFLLVLGRLWALQVVDHEAFADRALRQQQRVIDVQPPRGTIYDARGRQLAVSVEAESAFAVPRKIEDHDAFLAELEAVIDLDGDRLRRHLGEDREFVWIARKLTAGQARQVRELQLPGVRFLKEYRRAYPMGRLAATVLGFVGVDNEGLAGLEYQYDEQVRGRQGQRRVYIDARRDKVATPTLPEPGASPGLDLHLTLDATVQHMAEVEIRRTVEHHQAHSGSVVLLDPTNGDILALATYPSFDPNRYAETPAKIRRNRPVTDVYEPGSTFKVVTAAAALEAGAVTAEDTFYCGDGSITLRGVLIRDHKPFGLLTFREVMAKSSNIGVIKTVLQLDRAQFYDTIRRFGFGQPTGVDLPGESGGIFHPLDRWQALSAAYMSFGQNIAVTPLQLANAYAAVANGGVLLRPRLVTAVGDKARATEPEVLGRTTSEATARKLERLLEGVVERGATGQAAAIGGYRVAGKTGTAEIAEGGGYSEDRFVPSFVGFAPAGRPAVVGLVVIDTPRSGTIGGGQVAAPVFSRLLQRVLLYLGIPPDDDAWVDTWPRQDSPTETVQQALGGPSEPPRRSSHPAALAPAAAATAGRT